MKRVIKHLGLGHSLALGAMLSFATAVVLTKWGLERSAADFYNLAIWGWGGGMGLATLGFYLPIKSQRQKLLPELKAHRQFFALISVLTVINGASWFYGLAQINGGVVALIDQNVLVWSFVLGTLFLGERFSWRQLCAIGITLVGLGIISSLEGEVTWDGLVGLLICGWSIATQSLLIKRYPRSFNALALTFWRGWIMVLCSWLIAVSLGTFDWHIETSAWLALAVGQGFGLFAGRAMFIKAHEFLPMSHLSFLMLGIPVLVLSASYAFLGEPLGTQKLIGAAVMMAGLSWFISRKAKRGETPSLPSKSK